MFTFFFVARTDIIETFPPCLSLSRTSIILDSFLNLCCGRAFSYFLSLSHTQTNTQIFGRSCISSCDGIREEGFGSFGARLDLRRFREKPEGGSEEEANGADGSPSMECHLQVRERGGERARSTGRPTQRLTSLSGPVCVC